MISKVESQKAKGKSKEKGQALVTLLVFMMMATVIISGAVAATIINTQSTGKLAGGEEALKVAEAGADNAVLRLVRDPNYSGEVLTVGGGTATITVTGQATKTVLVEGASGDFRRKVQVLVNYSGNTMNVSSWNEIN